MKITIVTADDWEALYVNGHLENENHSIQASRALEIVSKIFNMLPDSILQVETVEADEEWASERGSMPTYLQDVRKAKKR